MSQLVKIFNVRPIGLLHIGAHEAEEIDEYFSSGIRGTEPIRWIEANPNLAKSLVEKLDAKDNVVINAAVWDIEGEKLSFNVTSAPASSSLLPLGSHKDTYPNIEVIDHIEVETRRIDSLFTDEDLFDFVVMDIQGAESRALAGFGKVIERVKWIYLEVAKSEIYLGSGTVVDIDIQLAKLGFSREITFWQRKLGWGDALYIRNGLTKISYNQYLSKQILKFRWFFRSCVPEWAFPILVKLKALVGSFK